MAKTIIGLFDSVSEAQHVFQELVDQGFDRGDISVLAYQDRASATAAPPAGHLAPCPSPDSGR
jgi:hypothetical protein